MLEPHFSLQLATMIFKKFQFHFYGSFNLFADMEVSVVSTDQFTGYAFPDPTSKLNITDSIKLPSEIFTNSAAGKAVCCNQFSFMVFLS